MAEEQNTNEVAEAAADKPSQQFAMQRIYLKDLSFETPMGLDALRKTWKPQVNQELNTKTSKAGEDIYEVVLTLTVTVKLEEETAFLVEVHQAGLFAIKGIEGQQLAQVLNSTCPNILFPYAREAIDSTLTKGSFPALMLPPINFDALFAQAVAQARQKAESGESTTVN